MRLTWSGGAITPPGDPGTVPSLSKITSVFPRLLALQHTWGQKGLSVFGQVH